MSYDYGNARLRAMKSRLLPVYQLEALSKLRTVSAFIAELAQTPYRKAAEYAAVTATGIARVGEMVSTNMVETLGRARSFYAGDAQHQVDLLLEFYDVQNLKAVFRGLDQNIAPDEIKGSLMPIGRLTTHLLNELINAGNVREAIDRLVTLRDPLAQTLLVLRAQHPGWILWQLELALDKWYFDPSRRVNGSARLKEYFDLQSDITNLMTMLRFAHTSNQRQILSELLGIALEGLIVPTGTLSTKRLVSVAMADTVEEAINELQGTKYYSVLKTGLVTYQHSARLSTMERALLHYRLKQCAHSLVIDPLGIGVPIGYFNLKENEGRNLRQIAWGIHLGMDRNTIISQLEVL